MRGLALGLAFLFASVIDPRRHVGVTNSRRDDHMIRVICDVKGCEEGHDFSGSEPMMVAGSMVPPGWHVIVSRVDNREEDLPLPALRRRGPHMPFGPLGPDLDLVQRAMPVMRRRLACSKHPVPEFKESEDGTELGVFE